MPLQIQCRSSCSFCLVCFICSFCCFCCHPCRRACSFLFLCPCYYRLFQLLAAQPLDFAVSFGEATVITELMLDLLNSCFLYLRSRYDQSLESSPQPLESKIPSWQQIFYDCYEFDIKARAIFYSNFLYFLAIILCSLIFIFC